MPQVTPSTLGVSPSGIRRIHEIAITLDGVVSLAVGEPDVPVADHIIEAARQAWADDDTNYTANGGIAPLREAIVARMAAKNGIEVDTEQVWVTIGATQALYLAMTLVLEPGDELLVPDPGYTTFTMAAQLHHATPVPYPLRPENGFLPSVAELEARVTPQTRALIVNSPSNPLGTVLDAETARDILEFARRHDLWIISDEVYEAFSWGRPHTAMASLDQDDRVLSVFSLSKTYALTGARVGWLVVPHGLGATMRTVQEAIISCVSAPDQRAAVAALTGPQDHVAESVERYRGHLALATELLDAAGIRYQRPDGAFYLWIDVRHASDGNVAAWAEKLLYDERIAVAPGSAFGASGEGWIRICSAADPADIRRGIEAIARVAGPAPAQSIL